MNKMKWIYSKTEKRYLELAEVVGPVDVYVCPYNDCGMRHRVAGGKIPVQPFCWKCKRRVYSPGEEINPVKPAEENPVKNEKEEKGSENMTVKEWLENAPKLAYSDFNVRAKAKCADGFEISIQQSPVHYCNTDEVELGFPSEPDQLIMEYAEDASDPTETVYGCVPIPVVDKLVLKHGGIVGAAA